jgi:protein gp37
MDNFPEPVLALLRREGTGISWTHLTFNPWIGCQKVSPACAGCYAEIVAKNRLNVAWGPGAERRRTKPATWAKVRRWQRVAAASGVTLRVFCASLADWADNAVDDAWRADLAAEITATPNLQWLMLTKRIGIARRALERMFPDGVPANVALGVTIANQEEADRDMPKALSVKAGLGIRRLFLSCEPLLGPLDLTKWLAVPGAIDLVIAGGESGTEARPMHPDWPWIVQGDCEDAGVPFHFKQWGEWKPWAPSDRGRVRHVSLRDGASGDEPGRIDGERNLRADTRPVSRAGTVTAGRTLRGKEHQEQIAC